VTSVFDAGNACIFAYGASGTGKTYTMLVSLPLLLHALGAFHPHHPACLLPGTDVQGPRSSLLL
jgi:hypothetical protein